jgi:hypothetical protein
MSHGITQNDQMFSVRRAPWHGLGVVLDEYPKSIDEALDKAGLGWKVTHNDVLVVKAPEWTDDFGTKHPAELIPATDSRRTSEGTPARCWESSRMNMRSYRTSTRFDSWTR